MNKFIYKVIKWVENPESVIQKDREENNKEASYADYSVGYAAAYTAAYFAAENSEEAATIWVNEYLRKTGESKQDYLFAIEEEKVSSKKEPASVYVKEYKGLSVPNGATHYSEDGEKTTFYRVGAPRVERYCKPLCAADDPWSSCLSNPTNELPKIEEEKVLTDTKKEIEGAISDAAWKDAPDWADRLMRSDTGNYFWCNIEKYLHLSRPIGEVPAVFSAAGHSFTIGDFELIQMRPDEWKKGEERMKPIGQNGNDGEHYAELENNKSKYHREIKKGVFVDVYDVLSAFEVVNPAMQHALKKMLAPGKRGAKDTVQDMQEAIQSIERAIELEGE